MLRGGCPPPPRWRTLRWNAICPAAMRIHTCERGPGGTAYHRRQLLCGTAYLPYRCDCEQNTRVRPAAQQMALGTKYIGERYQAHQRPSPNIGSVLCSSVSREVFGGAWKRFSWSSHEYLLADYISMACKRLEEVASQLESVGVGLRHKWIRPIPIG